MQNKGELYLGGSLLLRRRGSGLSVLWLVEFLEVCGEDGERDDSNLWKPLLSQHINKRTLWETCCVFRHHNLWIPDIFVQARVGCQMSKRAAWHRHSRVTRLQHDTSLINMLSTWIVQLTWESNSVFLSSYRGNKGIRLVVLCRNSLTLSAFSCLFNQFQFICLMPTQQKHLKQIQCPLEVQIHALSVLKHPQLLASVSTKSCYCNLFLFRKLLFVN